MSRLRSYVVALTVAAATIVAPAATAQEQPAGDPNYVWRTDPVSKALAGKPSSERVLHRVPGSFHDASPVAPEAQQAEAERGHALFGPGTPIFIGEGAMCTVSVAGFDNSGRKLALTAGHCGEVGQPVYSADALGVGQAGRIVAVNPALDYAVIELGDNAEVTRTYNGLTVNHLGAAPRTLGQVVCKSGFASAHTCGITWLDDGVVNLNQVCAMQGDSGAPLVAGDALVGIVNGGVITLPCHTPLQGPLFSPTASARIEHIIADLGDGFRLP